MFYRNKKNTKLDDALITPFDLSSKEGAFELRKLDIHPKYLLLQHTAFIAS